MRAVVEVNRTRKDFIADSIIARKPKLVDIYRLVMKQDSDNFQVSTIQSVMKRIKARGIEIMVDEPVLEGEKLYNSRVVSDFDTFKAEANVIVSNRMAVELQGGADKVYTRDLFNND